MSEGFVGQIQATAHDFCGFFAFTRLGVDEFHAALAQFGTI